MVTLSPAAIVVVEFPFSDLSGSKLRPAVLVDTGRGEIPIELHVLHLRTLHGQRQISLTDETSRQ